MAVDEDQEMWEDKFDNKEISQEHSNGNIVDPPRDEDLIVEELTTKKINNVEGKWIWHGKRSLSRNHANKVTKSCLSERVKDLEKKLSRKKKLKMRRHNVPRELELEDNREAMDLSRICDKEEDEENRKHHEAIREMRESHTKRMANLREKHAKQWEEFLHLTTQRKQERAHEQLSNSRYQNSVETFPPSRSHEAYGDFQLQRHEEFGKA
ncbi:hypothetical protein POM88_032969 [Heracleum sosnowskyi]|uniref:Uncharacterized protein n=1 Tax=Heracleum sosnowskyi TaxID=360622 RepID=A0AAD8I0P7_9APIA|nr:hypothetical protein POM88_032969 [Heracleum sosnowskyi]